MMRRACSSHRPPALLGWQRAAAAGTRIKDIIAVQGVRDNQLVGYGLVIGLQRHRRQPAQLALHRAVAAVDARPHGHQRAQRQRAHAQRRRRDRHGQPAGLRRQRARASTSPSPRSATPRSLAGGTLVMTPLTGADGEIYAVAQGPVAVSGFPRSGKAETLTQGVPTDRPHPQRRARRARGRRPASPTRTTLVLELRNPDFTTAVRVADAINAYTAQRFGVQVAREHDLRTIVAASGRPTSAPRASSPRSATCSCEPDAPARVVVDERTGTIVIGKDVQISTRRRRARHPDRARHRDAAGLAARAVLRGRDGGRRPRPSSTADQQGGNLAIVRGTNLQTLVARPQPHRRSSRPASSPSCRRSSPPARCRPTWWCNDAHAAVHDAARQRLAARDRGAAPACVSAATGAAGLGARGRVGGADQSGSHPASRTGRRHAGHAGRAAPRDRVPRPVPRRQAGR